MGNLDSVKKALFCRFTLFLKDQFLPVNPISRLITQSYENLQYFLSDRHYSIRHVSDLDLKH